jgi:hypothetical protein
MEKRNANANLHLPLCGEVDPMSEAKRIGWGAVAYGTHRPPPGSLRSPASPQGGGEKIAIALSGGITQ